MKAIFIIYAFLACLFAQAQKTIQSGVFRWEDHPVNKKSDREGRKIFEGSSPHFSYVEIHATTQFKGAKPSPAHASEDIEEVIIVKEGLMKVTVEGVSQTIGARGVILLMPQQMHSIQNIGDGPLTYYVMRYRSKKPMDIARGQKSGGTLVLNNDSLTYKTKSDGKKGGTPYFDRSTAMCQRFEMHITQLNVKGPSHKPHEHVESEIILILEGETEMTINGKNYKAKAGDFYYANSWESHGISNSSDAVCSYFAFKWE